LYVFLISPIRDTYTAHLILLQITLVIRVTFMKLLLMQPSTASSHLGPLRSKYSPQQHW
jgi:hypothetical protein